MCIRDSLKVLIPESTLLFTRTQTERICLRYSQPIAPFFNVLKKRFDKRYFLPEQEVSSLPLWRSKQRAGFSSLVCSREVISDIVLEFYCVQSLTSVFVSCFLFYWSTLVRLVSSLWRNSCKHWICLSNATETVFRGCDFGVRISQPNLFRFSSGKKESALWDEYISDIEYEKWPQYPFNHINGLRTKGEGGGWTG